MNEQLSDLKSHVLELEHSVRSVEARLAAIEHRLSVASQTTISAPTSESTRIQLPGSEPDDELTDDRDASVDPGQDFVAIVSFVGRTFLALGGAYLLRALTDSHLLAQPAGVMLGFAYAIAWLVVADRTGAADQRCVSRVRGCDHRLPSDLGGRHAVQTAQSC